MVLNVFVMAQKNATQKKSVLFYYKIYHIQVVLMTIYVIVEKMRLAHQAKHVIIFLKL